MMSVSGSGRTNLVKLALVAVAVALAGCLLVLVGTEKPAKAAFPGVNGKIAFAGLMTADLNTPDGDDEIFTINPDGTGLTQVTDNTGINDTAPSWSPDGATIAYTAYNQSNSQQSALYTVSASGGNPNLVIEGASTDAAWSPDGNRIAYSASDGTDSEIYTVSASGGTPTKVTDNTQSDFKPSWSPDGTNIVYTGLNDAGYLDIYKIPVTQQGAANGAPINVTNDTALQDDPDYSPDGTAIAIRLHESSETFSGIATIPIAGGVPTRLVNYSVNLNNIGFPAYAPDGTKIAYSEVVDSNWQIFTVSSSGGTPTAVTDDNSIIAAGPDWQPLTYNFSGFDPPVDNLPTLNRSKAGKTIPVRFSLGGDKGLGIFATGYPKSGTIPCDSSAPVDGIEETIAGKNGLSYNAGTGGYEYDWATSSTWSGCRQFVMKLEDGSVQRANFIFK